MSVTMATTVDVLVPLQRAQRPLGVGHEQRSEIRKESALQLESQIVILV